MGSNNLIYTITYSGFDDVSEYEFKINKNKIKMHYYGAGWSIPTTGKIAMSLKDTDNGIKIKTDKGTKINLDYAEMEALYTLLTYYFRDGQSNKAVITKVEKIIVN